MSDMYRSHFDAPSVLCYFSNLDSMLYQLSQDAEIYESRAMAEAFRRARNALTPVRRSVLDIVESEGV